MSVKRGRDVVQRVGSKTRSIDDLINGKLNEDVGLSIISKQQRKKRIAIGYKKGKPLGFKSMPTKQLDQIMNISSYYMKLNHVVSLKIQQKHACSYPAPPEAKDEK